ncbi:hypothetical protein CONCODRAFT_79602, partial [Conidiobolus coronatus NRRL 28638]
MSKTENKFELKNVGERIEQNFIQLWDDVTTTLDKCIKPDKKQFLDLAWSLGLAFIVVGIVGYFVRLFFIPVNRFLL